MATLSTALLVALLALVICAAISDAKSRRIPNWLSGFGLIAAFTLHIAQNGLHGAWFAAQGMVAAFAFYMVLYLIRALGAGDVKLMAAVGAFAGLALWIQIFVATAVIGAAAALALSLAKGRLKTTVWNTGFIAGELLHFRAPYIANKALDVKSPASITMPHGISIAFAVLLLLLVR